MPLSLDAALPALIFFAPFAVLLVAVSVRRWIARRLARAAVEDVASQRPYGDVVHLPDDWEAIQPGGCAPAVLVRRLPIGATPEALREDFHDRVVAETGQRDHG